jgi:hypothetical protein
VSDPTDSPVVFLVVRRSRDCSVKMVEIMGVCATLRAAEDLRHEIYDRSKLICSILEYNLQGDTDGK